MKQILCERSVLDTGIAAGFMTFPGVFIGQAFEVQSRAAWMVDGTFRNLHIEIETAPGVGNSWTFDILKNGSSTGLGGTISGTSTTLTDSGTDVTAAPGDYFTMQVSSSGTPANSGSIVYSCEFESDNTGESGYSQTYGSMPDDTNPRRSGVFWACYQGSDTGVWNGTNAADEIANIVPCDGTITGTAMRINQSPGGGSKAITVVIYHAPAGSSTFTKQDGSGATVDTRVTCSGTTQNNTATFALPVLAGDRVYYEAIPENTPSTLGMLLTVGTRFEADVDGESIMGGWMKSEPAPGAASFFTPHSVHTTYSSTEGGLVLIGNPTSFALSRFYGHIRTAPGGSGRSWEFLIRRNGGTPSSALSYIIANTDQDGSDLLGSYAINSGDTFELRSTPSGTPLNTTLSFSMVQSPAPQEIRGSAVFGVTTTVTATRAIAFGLDGNTNLHNEAGKFKVFGDFEVTGTATFAGGTGTGDVSGPASSVDGEIVLFNGTTGKALKSATGTGFVRAASGVYSAAKLKRVVGAVIGDGTNVISTGVAGFVSSPVAGTITKVRLLSSDAAVTSGSIVVDIWKDTYANYPPTVGDTITASAKPTITTATKSEDSTLTGWTTAVAAGDVFGFNVDSVTSLKRVTVELTVEE